MSGMDAAAFAPYANTTRAQIAVIFYRMEGSPAVEGENSFADVVRGSGTAWFYDAVTWAQQNGIMGDLDGKKFGPDDPVTREQLASIFIATHSSGVMIPHRVAWQTASIFLI